eukprot:3718603-Prymnesium_polylepis.1
MGARGGTRCAVSRCQRQERSMVALRRGWLHARCNQQRVVGNRMGDGSESTGAARLQAVGVEALYVSPPGAACLRERVGNETCVAM